MRKIAIAVGLFFVAAGALGLIYHLSLYLNGAYESAGRLHIDYERYLTSTGLPGERPPVDEERDAARVAEYVREKLIYGSLYAVVPMALGCALLLAAWRWRSRAVAGGAPAAADGSGAS